MRLSDLIGTQGTVTGVEIAGLTADSRAVEPGWLFAALPGAHADGRAFIADALARGAAALLVPAGSALDRWGIDRSPVPVIEDPHPRRRYAQLAARFWGRQPATAVAVTGTNGKTSVVRFVRQIWRAAGLSGAAVGTLGVDSDPIQSPGGLTTPDPAHLHKVLAHLADAGVTHVAFEASSHGLDQARLDGVRLAAGGFTHISQDHLDYHGTMEAYFFAKARLFGELLEPGSAAVVNIDTPGGRSMEDLAWGHGLKRLSVGRDPAAHLRLVAAEPGATGQRLSLTFDGAPYRVDLPLVGLFQAENAILAAGLAIAAGLPADTALGTLAHLTGVPGRMELVGRAASGAPVYVDYAHTDGGLETVLAQTRPHVRGRLTVVFGAGGDRDRTKRPAMGRAAARHADRVIVTDDNPRGEDPAEIRAEIREGCPEAEAIGDRAAAIAAAIAGLGPDDALIIAGKGHETGQIVGDTVLPFNDREVAQAHLSDPASETLS
ncbi:UDP-N-acetylmuramoylalanyl-D-glutamate--2,6-diaminopimelate ligase [Rhodothalassium salexigens DSM 2132]|uniref:UDP-N-acetylmuramoyl-L-alanyl-D-glutamate--2,6-diaminopimelate ligase n=1 Tax=Rhodothalassium salexigens DSM 2132 TaxID=1188247 RepID=A0A4V2SNU9_RHOSA|nr:UDP-N-acetylmuramoyl-L-alanyl-D-glutamate--2,6-diaminopimelate ligase [Rhodothalassium salexigens]MBB4212243.1 UDP-N-acetylmuramoyl-L-alanyl-D-glutamate--2,6-diaminopimelate ligase [Rhodothalassium salexigens DSM 2132]MBK1639031.1 UDP-N-acetylmuramoyl-L-alanyl-D-glutamate--2,6-diaminopimelate ligase [Rhodothalassium salexigens DSM 2132]TCP32606.1 UDP-N-acetylmuramoylalanyl-D-glutamate--2,6-diaminopimelate ligase [Rhodothalassium salexigens DSM 2132]